MGDIDANVEPHSGDIAKIIGEHQFRALHHRSKEIKALNPSKDTSKTVQSTLTVNGEFQTTFYLTNHNNVLGKLAIRDIKDKVI